MDFQKLINEIIAEQKARVGRFLTYEQLLLNLIERIKTIKKYDNQSGEVLLSRANTLYNNQKNLETSGLSLINNVMQLKEDPVVKMVIEGKADFNILSIELINRINDLWNKLKDFYNISNTLSGNLDKHEKEIKNLETDVINKENELIGKGLLPKVSHGFSDIFGNIKTILIYGGVIAVSVFVLPKVLSLFEKEK